MSILSANGPEMRDTYRVTSDGTQLQMEFALPDCPQGQGFGAILRFGYSEVP